MPNSLPVSRLIAVSVTLTPQAAQSQNLSSLLVLGTSDVIDVVERMRAYSSIEEVADQFGTTAPEYLAALLWFQQSPQPTELLIGRWADVDAAGQLVGGTLTTPNQALDAWTDITDGSFQIEVDGGAADNITGLDFSGEVNLNGVAAVIEAALTGATVVYDSNFQRFVFTSATTGATSTIDFLDAAPSGTPIAAMLAGTLATNAYRADGIDAETPVAAVAEFDERFGQQWYALTVLGMSLGSNGEDENALAVAAYIEATNTKHFFGVTTQDTGVLSAVDTTDIASALKALGYFRTAVQYSSSSPYAVVSLLGRILTTDYAGNNTVITLMFKDEPGIVAEELTTSQANAAQDKNANVFAAYNNDTAIIQYGTVANGEFIDVVMGADWLAVDIMTALYNLLYTTPTKIPQTDAGVNMLVATIDQVCSQGVANGLLAPGVWNSAGFGTLKRGDMVSSGWYVYAPPVATQTAAARAARRSPSLQVAAKLAGAIHQADIAIVVNS